MVRVQPSGIGRVLNGGQQLACGHCRGDTEGLNGELRGVDVSPQGVGTFFCRSSSFRWFAAAG